MAKETGNSQDMGQLDSSIVGSCIRMDEFGDVFEASSDDHCVECKIPRLANLE